jgi:heavy metal sensor kinase
VLALVLLVFIAGTSLIQFYQLRSQLDRHAIQDLETVEGLLYFTSSGQLNVREDYHNHPESRQVQERMLELLSPEGLILYRNSRLGSRALGSTPFAGEGVGGYFPRSARLSDGTRIRLISRAHAVDGRPMLIRLAYSEEPIWLRLAELVTAALLVLPIVLAVAGLAGYGLARRVLSPLEQMASRAEQITPDRLNERLPTGDADDELGHLARVFNGMLARLEQSFEQLRRFTSDASHELRTPLTAIRSVGEVGLRKNGTREEYRDVIGSMLEEVNSLTRLIDSLLTISRADAGHIYLNPTVFPAMELLREAACLFDVLIEEKSQSLFIEGDESATIQGDRLLLRQAMVNILHNAVKYSPTGGTISARVRRTEPGRILVEITDSGPGISEEHASKVFDRFYRVDAARTREAGGAGLGLSVAKWAVQAHSGEIVLRSKPGLGSNFQIFLPAVSLG